VPLFLWALRQVDPTRYRRVILRELGIALVILVGFLFVGQYVEGEAFVVVLAWLASAVILWSGLWACRSSSRWWRC
jgi:hypothetical protein